MSGAGRTRAHILIAEDEEALAGLLSKHLVGLGHRVTSVRDGAAAMRALHTEAFDVALLDIVMPKPDGLEVLRMLRDDPDPPAVIIMTGQGTIDTAVQAMRLGAVAYLSKPYRMAELGVVIAKALENRALAHENAALRVQVARAEAPHEFVTAYAPLRAVFATAMAGAGADTPVLIIGAPGTGKCALARAIHTRSARGARPFVQLDPAALAGADVERTLFGGGRDHGSRARAVLATRGSLYMHEVSALPEGTQATLARALVEGRFRAGDAASERAIRTRIIGATQLAGAKLSARVDPDLLNAFGALRIELPTLRERAVDIVPLAEAFLASAGDASALRFSDDALAALERYSWPGNVAELRAVTERARLLARDGVIREADLALARDAALDLAEVERRHIRAVLEAKAWHQGRAAESLGIAPKTLYRKMREFGIQKPRGSERVV